MSRKVVNTNNLTDEAEKSEPSPRGRQAVIDAILKATSELLLKFGPSEISVRAIAERAGVKHPMIYRHFGSKDALIKAVHMREIHGIGDDVAGIESISGNVGRFLSAFEKNRWRQIALARAMIDGIDPRQLQTRFPVMEQFLRMIEGKLSESGSATDPKVFTAVLSAAAMGWMLYGPLISTATGLDELSPERQRDSIVAMLEKIIESTK